MRDGMGSIKQSKSKSDLVAFHHHPSVRSSNATGTNDANSLVLQQLPNEESWKPTLVLASPHEDISLCNSTSSCEGQGCCKLSCSLSEHP